MAFKESTSPRDLLCLYAPGTVGPKVAYFKGFWDLAWDNVGQILLKIALDHLFEHPKWSRNNHF